MAGMLWGCAQTATSPAPASATPSAAAEPISLQLLRVVPDLKSQRFSNLLSFEAQSDLAFVDATGGSGSEGSGQAHTGKSSLQIPVGTSAVSVKLSSLLQSPDALPGTWTLVGGYFLSESPAEISVSLLANETVLARNVARLSPGVWQAVMLDISTVPEPSVRGAALSLKFEFLTSGKVWCDDVMLVDNSQTLFQPPAAAAAGTWSIRRRGLNYIGDMPDHYRFTLPAPYESDRGWSLVEVNNLRARFSAFDGARQLVIYSDGRAFLNGAYRPIGGARGIPALTEAHASPAQIEIAQGAGRVNRSAPGDANNDGYNETLGSYALIAAGPRMELTITPRSAILLNPILEIANLPSGELLVTSEGRLIERWERLADGTVLIEVPGPVERSTVVNLRVQGGESQAEVR